MLTLFGHGHLVIRVLTDLAAFWVGWHIPEAVCRWVGLDEEDDDK